jgi:hypothetical protein
MSGSGQVREAGMRCCTALVNLVVGRSRQPVHIKRICVSVEVARSLDTGEYGSERQTGA